MDGKRRIRIGLGLTCMFLLLICLTVPAAADEDPETVRAGQSDVLAGVKVDYLGKIQFLVLDGETGGPIDGVSVEIYIPGLDRYELSGVTDAGGSLILDVVYGSGSGTVKNSRQVSTKEGPLILPDNHISYRVYKDGWLPYPCEGSLTLEGSGEPQVDTIHLYRKKEPGEGGGDSGNSGSESSGSGTQESPLESTGILPVTAGGTGENSEQGIPRTGVAGTAWYWAAGLFFFLLAGGITAYLLRHQQDIQNQERQDRNDQEQNGQDRNDQDERRKS